MELRECGGVGGRGAVVFFGCAFAAAARVVFQLLLAQPHPARGLRCLEARVEDNAHARDLAAEVAVHCGNIGTQHRLDGIDGMLRIAREAKLPKALLDPQNALQPHCVEPALLERALRRGAEGLVRLQRAPHGLALRGGKVRRGVVLDARLALNNHHHRHHRWRRPLRALHERSAAAPVLRRLPRRHLAQRLAVRDGNQTHVPRVVRTTPPPTNSLPTNHNVTLAHDQLLVISTIEVVDDKEAHVSDDPGG